jgi:hypothetical protein
MLFERHKAAYLLLELPFLKFHNTQERGSMVEALFRLVARVGARHRKLI